MGALDGFYSTWNKARETFGQGTPDDGSQYDGSSRLLEMKASVEAAAPDDRWQGSGSQAYAAANKEHASVYEKLAELDKKMANEVKNAAAVVTTGRTNLDTAKSWVNSAVDSLPATNANDREQKLIPIAREGISKVDNIVKSATDQMTGIKGNVDKLKGEYETVKNTMKFGPDGEKKDDKDTEALGSKEDEDKDVHEQAEQDVQDALAGDKEAAGRVEQVLNQVNPGRALDEKQGAYLSQMQAQQQGMTVEELKTTEERLGEHKDIISNSWQLMSNDDVKFPKTDTEVGALDNPEAMVDGGKSQLPQSVQQALGRDNLDSILSKLDPVSAHTDNAREVSTIADIVSHGDSKLQQGTALDEAMLDWSRDTLHDPLRPSIFSAVGISDDYDHFADARDDALADVFNVAGRDHEAVAAELTSETGQQFLTDLHNHAWADTPDAPDNKNSVHSLISWIGDEAHSPNEEVATRAGQAAHALAVNLDNNHEHYLNPPDIPGAPVTPNAANLNPALIAADAIALEPYQEALVGHDSGVRGFEPVGSPGDGDLKAARNIFAVIDSDPGAAKGFNAAAEQKVLDHQQTFANATAEHGPMADTPKGDMKAAAYLQGVINGGAEQEAVARGLQGKEIAESIYNIKKSGLDSLFGALPGKDYVPGYELTRDMIETGVLGVNPEPGQPTPVVELDTSQHALNSTYYQVATALDVHRGVPDIPEEFFNGNELKSPDQISAADRSEYSTALERYLFNQGYPSLGSTFDRYYEDGAGK